MSTDPRFFEFDSAKQALDEIALFKIRMVGNVDIVYTQPFLRCAAAVRHFEPGEFLRLIIILKRELKRTGGISRWQDTVDRLGSLERDRLKALQNPRRNDSGSTGGERGQPTIEMKAITPWPQSVPAGPLFDAIETFVNRFVRLNKDQTVAIVLWIAFTHVFDVADVSPRLALISPKKRCGKSTVERVLSLLCPRPLVASNISPSAIFRAIDAYHPVLLLDEVDTFAGRRSKQSEKSEEIRGILNSGHTRDSAFVIRSDKAGDSWVARQFSTWAPIVYAAIGRLPDTWEDRSIIIRMKRRLASETVEKLTRRNLKTVQGQADEILRKLARWALDNMDTLEKAPEPVKPKSLNDRQDDNWDLLLSIAELVAPEWAKRAFKAADTLSGDRMDASTDLDFDQQLLVDIKGILDRYPLLNPIGSTWLCGELKSVTDSPWSSMKPNDKPISNKRLAMMLKPFEVYPTHAHEGNQYTRSHLEDAFQRYLPASSTEGESERKDTLSDIPSPAPLPKSAPQSFNGSQTLGGEGEAVVSQSFTEGSDGGLKNDNSATGPRTCEPLKDQSAFFIKGAEKEKKDVAKFPKPASENPDEMEEV